MKKLFVSLFLCICLPFIAHAAPKTVHITVALCDNIYQRIAPVPLKIGNGQETKGNLYWGAAYGVRHFFNKQPEWQRVHTEKNLSKYILERVVWKHKTKDVYLVADAYNGKYIKQTTKDFLQFAAGRSPIYITAKDRTIAAGGASDMVIYIGHNGLMDFSLFFTPKKADDRKRLAAVFACQSKNYFTNPLAKAGAVPVILTTSNLSPEAYTSHALIAAWLNGASYETMRNAVGDAYATYQKISSKAARRMFSFPSQ